MNDIREQQIKHTGHRVMAIAPHVWFCWACAEEFDGDHGRQYEEDEARS